MKIGFLLLKTLQFNIFKMAANGGPHFEINIRTENQKSQFMSQVDTVLTNVILLYCEINNFIGLFYEYCIFIRHYWKKINIHCEVVTSQPH